MKTQIHIVNQQATRSVANPVPDGVNVIEEIIAEEGFMLTQSAEVPVGQRIIASAVMLGKGCKASDWNEITREEADGLLRQKEESVTE